MPLMSVRGRHVQSRSQFEQIKNAEISLPAFNTADVSAVQVCAVREFLLGEANLSASLANLLA